MRRRCRLRPSAVLLISSAGIVVSEVPTHSSAASVVVLDPRIAEPMSRRGASGALFTLAFQCRARTREVVHTVCVSQRMCINPSH